MPEINWHESKVHSQNGEDGVIDHIFDVIGVTNRKFIEFGYHPRENNSKNLIEKRGFTGAFIDGNVTSPSRPGVQTCRTYLTKRNINKIISRYCTGDIDFLSVDVDGVDLHLLDSITVIRPRVVCVEYCASIGPYLSVTVPYKDVFDRHAEHKSGMYCGASLEATARVMMKKGYVLVGSVSGLNAFFVKYECAGDLTPLRCREAWQPHEMRTFHKKKRFDGVVRTISQKEQYSTLKDLNWVRVSRDGVIGVDAAPITIRDELTARAEESSRLE